MQPASPTNHSRREGSKRVRRVDVDILRALGILFVVMYHDATVAYVWPIGYWLRSLMSTCVPIFFFTSGVLLAVRNDSARVWRRRLMSTFLAAVGLGFATGVYYSTTTGDFSLEYALVSFLSFREGESVWLWFLQSLFLVYLCAPALIALKQSRTDLWRITATLILIFVFGLDLIRRVFAFWSLETSEFGEMIWDYLQGFNPVPWVHPEALGYFVAGMCICKWKPSPHCVIPAIATVIVAPIPLMYYGAAMSQNMGTTYDIIWNGYGCITTLCSTIALYTLAQRIAPHVGKFGRGFTALIGANTFVSYALNWFVTQPIRPYMGVFPTFGERLAAGTAISAVIVLVLSSASEIARRMGRLIAGALRGMHKDAPPDEFAKHNTSSYKK